MAMEIGNKYGVDYISKVEAENQKRAGESAKAREKDNKSEGIQTPKDEYVSSEKSGKKVSGLYHMGQDENGNPKVIFDDPKKAKESENAGEPERAKEAGSEQPEGVKPKEAADDDGKKVVTANMDKVKKEIKELKEKKKQLEQELKAAEGDEQKTKELKAKLRQVEAELSVKDTDDYKKRHAEYTEEE